ncbi:hypothetical protein PFLUV_G00182320 [Perca fluviatilis]|uniref:Small integral membrane protein 22 n=2 Tax=Perca fluviatilis TaxID=8168 RepID=A0A6A5EBQ9_PERFL|nr:small integral membrane protein 22 isoform X1 [Perca fluviatilis]KAF1380036.1 hypothetical protein PFLUV_G00182320 [Perca fluviatilis]
MIINRQLFGFNCDTRGSRCGCVPPLSPGSRSSGPGRKGSLKTAAPSTAYRAMDQRGLQQEFQVQFSHVVSRVQFFQSDWDIASFAIFFIFIGMVLLLVILVLIRCCCCCCCDDERPRGRKVGIENMALEP